MTFGAVRSSTRESSRVSAGNEMRAAEPADEADGRATDCGAAHRPDRVHPRLVGGASGGDTFTQEWQ
jgi:hypothetical protein